jgi:hypothetical protein
MPREGPLRECRRCAHFRDDPAAIEALVTGLTSFGSGYGSARADDGLCLHHQRYLSGRASCPDFDPG